MGDQIFAAQVAQRILEFHQLDENIVLWIEARRGLRRLEVEGEPFLNTFHSGALREIQKQGEIQNDRRRQNRIAAKEVDLDLHRIAEPAKNIDIVPAFFVVSAGRVIVDANYVRKVLVEFRIDFRLKNIFEYRQLGFFFRLERFRIVEHFAIAVAENVG